MEVRLLKKSFINKEEFYIDFLNDNIKNKEEYFTQEKVFIKDAPNFPIYISKGNEETKTKLFF